MEPSVELSLLQRRFPHVEISDCGRLLGDFFCARSVDLHTYEGRLFLMENALLFVSTYSNAYDYDVFISTASIGHVTALHRSIISSLEVSLTDKQEHFTNFYNLSGVITVLLKQLPDKVTEIKQSASLKKFDRLTSVPASTLRHHTPSPSPSPSPVPTPIASPSSIPPTSPDNLTDESVNPLKADPCPFFTKAGFCPRKPLCKLSHISPSDHTHQQPAFSSKAAKPATKISNRKSKKENLTHYLGSPKRFHASEQEGNRLKGSLKTSGISVGGEGRRKAEKGRGKKRAEDDKGRRGEGSQLKPGVGYVRSLSFPPDVLNLGPVLQPSRKATKRTKSKGRQHPSVDDKNSASTCGVSDSEKGTSSSTTKPFSEPPDLPKLFNFSVLSKQEVGRETETQQSEGQPEGEKNGVFVFSATSPSSPSHVSGKRRNATVRFSPSALERSDNEEGSSEEEEMAILAQQLELGSDNDSIQGDLDMEYQRKILAMFASGKEGEDSPVTSPAAAASSESSGSGGEVGKGGSLKRHPCMYFLSGYCQNGLACPNYHGMDAELEELEYGDIGSVSLPPKLKVFSAASADRSDINSGDKLILSPQILMACEQQDLSYPIAFKLEHPTSGKLVHAGVLEFTSPTSDAGYLPQWMMDHLQASEGDEVLFEHVDLPKGTFVRLQPVSSAWLGIPYDKRMAMMEFQLRNFQTLTEGTKVTLTYELNRYTLKVLECKPAEGISIVDADITTDIVEPADFSRFHSVEEGQAEHIGLDEPVKCSLKANAYRHFVLLSLPGQSLPSRLHVEVKQTQGDPDLFLSQTCTAPTQSRYTWCNQEVGGSVYHLSTDEKDYDITKPLYVGVVSLCEDTEFTLTLQREDTLVAAKARQLSPFASHSGQTLRTTNQSPVVEQTDISSSSTTTSSSSSPLPPGHERCSYCGSVMPSLRLIMHERHCMQSTFKCPICKACLPKAAEKKHHYIAHELLTCECGQEHTQLALHHHQETDCVKRTVKCPFKWCNLFFPMDQLQEHEHLCGRKKVPCHICKEEVSQLELEMHLEAFHAVDTTNIDWSKPLTKQVLAFKSTGPKFKCVCGSGFDFQDDMEVHQSAFLSNQLTECPMRRIAEDLATGSLQGEIVG